jgi:Na+-driven multidrug efflux pump
LTGLPTPPRSTPATWRYSALPLALSSSGGTILHFTDRVFLAWHAPESGTGAAGMIRIYFTGRGDTGIVMIVQLIGIGLNVAFLINNLAWQPMMIGIGMAVAMLVGRTQGAERPDLSRMFAARLHFRYRTL